MIADIVKLTQQWKSLPENELDGEISDFIRANDGNYIDSYKVILYRMYDDDMVRCRIKASFVRLASLYIDNNTRKILQELGNVSEGELYQKILDIFRKGGKSEVDKIYIFTNNNEAKGKLEKVLLELAPVFTHLKLLKEVEGWQSLSYKDLVEEVTKRLCGSGWDSSGSHITFIKEVYAGIESPLLRQRVDDVLLSLAEMSSLDAVSVEKCGRAIYASAKLKIPGAKQKLAKIVSQITDISDISYSSLIAWVNRALIDCQIQEAEEFLVKQLESLPENWSELIRSPKLDYSQRAHYMTLLTAYGPLLRLNKYLADNVARKVKLKG